MSRPGVQGGRGGLTPSLPLSPTCMPGRAGQKGCEWGQVLADAQGKNGELTSLRKYTLEHGACSPPHPSSAAILLGSSLGPGYSQRGRLRYFRIVLTFSATECWENDKELAPKRAQMEASPLTLS